MIFRDDELKVVQVHYELTDNMGKLLQTEVKAGILAKNAQEALQQLRSIISDKCKIRINQIADGGCIHIITDNVSNILTGKEKITKTTNNNMDESNNENTKHRGRPKGSPNKPKEQGE